MASSQRFQRYVAIGDSFTEGVGDPDPSRPNGVRGWADRVAEVLGGASSDFGYANLAIRGRLYRPILDEQVPAGLALRPDLVTLSAGGNDLLRPKVDIDAMVDAFAEAVDAFRAQGATVCLFTHGDGGSSGVFGAIRGRVAIFNELLRDYVAGDPDGPGGIVLVDNWRLKEGRDLRVWAEDRLHLNPIGHQGIAINVLDSLGVEHGLRPLPIPAGPARSRREQRRDDLAWARQHLAPWVGRRLRGTSSGDGVTARYADLTPIAAAKLG